MATNASFAAEDQTDEDFFDKLVDDDFDGGGQEGGKFQEGDDSDEMKAFGFEDSAGFVAKEKLDAALGAASSDVQTDETLIVATNSPSSAGSVIEHNNVDAAAESWSAVDPAMSKTAESGNAGVKEIQWNSLFTNSSAENDGFGSYADLFGDVGAGAGDLLSGVKESTINEVKEIDGGDLHIGGDLTNDASNAACRETAAYGTTGEQSANGTDVNSIEYWESQYPGWKYDPSTGQWYQVDSFDAPANDQQANLAGVSEAQPVGLEPTAEASYFQQAALSVANSVVDSGTVATVSSLNHGLQDNNGYPEHMVFDPQYPGWYYDTRAQEWRTLESYLPSNPETTHFGDHLNQNGVSSSDMLSKESSKDLYDGCEHALNNASQTTVTNGQYGNWDGVSTSYDQQLNQRGFESNGMLTDNISKNNSMNYGQHAQPVGNSQGFSSQGQITTWAPSVNSYQRQDMNSWQPTVAAINGSITDSRTNQRLDSSRNFVDNHTDQFSGFPKELTSAYDKSSAAHDDRTLQSFVPSENLSQQFNHQNIEPQQQFSNDNYSNQNPSYFTQQSHQSGSQSSYNPSMGRSSAGRPPHALVSFGFGGKLIVMKDNNSLVNSSYGNQDSAGGSIFVVNLLEVVTERNNGNAASSGCDYFQTLCQQSFPGPLVGSSVGTKELNKWIDDRISNCESSDLDYRKVESLRLLLSLLRISCQHYGKLRSPFGSDTSLKANDSPESAVAKLFAWVKGNGGQYGHSAHCLQQLPSEAQLRATASEVQNLLVSGSKKEALERALQGQLWGPALVLASQLGDQFYVDAVRQMALRQLVPGSPMRTLCLLIAGQPQAVFASDNEGAYSDAMNMYQQQSAQVGANSMLDDWQENLAVISANRTKDDELVIINLGDCLWRDRSEIIAAHICYLVADANFESYSDSARMCLISANHLKFPRTYASPAAIQMTELYEYSKVLGNSQFVLLPFQPYKLVYAYMLAELGKVSDSLKYCQAILKSLKTGRAPEVEFWKQIVTSLEERLRTHQQGGFSTNLAPAKLVGKLLNFFDSTTHRVIGGLPPPGPSAPHGSGLSHEHYQQPSGPRVLTSQSTMAMSSLVPSPSTEQVNEWSGQNSRMSFHSRSASEPNFGRTDQVEPSKETASPNAPRKASVSAGSRFGRFGFGSQLLQKTMGLVLKSRSDKQAKLGESNKFYYDEKLKRWVEEGAEPPAEEAALPPPPTAAAFQNGPSDQSNKSTSEIHHTNASSDQRSSQPSEQGSGIPLIPTGSSQFSARARTGVRSRYVDTYNQGTGSPAKTFQSPPLPSVKRAAPANAKFFVPTPSSMGEQTMGNPAESVQEASISENPSTSTSNEMTRSSATPSPSLPMQRFPSMVNISQEGNGDSSLPHSRRTASWGGSFSNSFSPPKAAEVKPLGDMLGFSPSTFSDASSRHMLPANGGSFGDDLQEVEL
uniref:Protein transport protein sec16 n=1 Tax=Kalanchoe fedtschenkoi TaxID=63787 RepID=A0A7N0U0X0_KALFE